MDLFVAIKIIKLKISFTYLLHHFVCLFMTAPSSVGIICLTRTIIKSDYKFQTILEYSTKHSKWVS